MSDPLDSDAGHTVQRLLLVLSNQNFRLTLQRILGRCGYRVDYAASGEEALESASREAYDAIVSDIHLPGQVCGLTLMHQLRAAGRQVPIIFLTEKETERIRAAIESGGPVTCVRLPLDVDRLKDLIARGCRG